MLPLGYIQHRDCCCLLIPNRVHRNDCLDSLQGEERHFCVTVNAIDFFPTCHSLDVHVQMEYKIHLKAIFS